MSPNDDYKTPSRPLREEEKVEMRRYQNRHDRRAMKKHLGVNKIKSGYAGQRFEVQCTKNGVSGCVVGWATSDEALEKLVRLVHRHPDLSAPKIIELGPEDQRKRWAARKS